MKKRIFTALTGLAAVCMLAACGTDEDEKNGNTGGASGDKAYKIGISQFVEHPSLNNATEGFKKAIEDAGIEVEYDEQNAQGDPNNAGPIANNFVSQGVDLIFANATPSALAAVNATKDIPVIFTSVTDPVGAKLVGSMEKPGGNVTGTSDGNPEAIPSTVQFMAEELGVKTIGTIYNSGEQNSVVQVEQMKEAAKKAGVKVVETSVSTSAEVKQAAESASGDVDAFYIITDNTVVSALESVVMVSNDQDIPLFVGELDSVERGGFAAYGFDYEDIGYQAGEMAADILKNGKKASEIPAQYPGNVKLVINEEAAAEMGIEIKEEWKEAEKK